MFTKRSKTKLQKSERPHSPTPPPLPKNKKEKEKKMDNYSKPTYNMIRFHFAYP